MATFRVDYVTDCGVRGEWHSDVEAKDAQEVERDVRSELSYVANTLKRNSGKTLKAMIVVAMVATDVRTITITTEEK